MSNIDDLVTSPFPDLEGDFQIEKPCLAPFQGIFQDYDGYTSVCCHRPIQVKTKTLSEAMNHERIAYLKNTFSQGMTPQECKCPIQLRHYITESINNARAIHRFSDSNLNKPILIDFNWSNKCNFACLGCSVNKSSTIHKHYSEIFDIFEDRGEVKIKIDYNKQDRFDYIIENSNYIKYIHLGSSGEPFMIDDIYELLELLIKNKLCDKIKILTHTNGSILKYKNKSMIDLLNHWGKYALVMISNDGSGKRGEYVRYGYKDKNWLKTYQALKKTDINVRVAYCLNIFNILYLQEDINWFKENCNKTDILLRYWEFPHQLTPNFLKYWKTLYNESIEIFNDTKKYYKDYKFAEQFLNKQVDYGFGFINDYERFSKFIKNIDEKRNTNFKETFLKLNEIILW
jgi:MoaA/NifB/PqqE/SkfB family radical SAM enzyme